MTRFVWHDHFRHNFFNILATVTKKYCIFSSHQAASIGAFRFTVGLLLTDLEKEVFHSFFPHKISIKYFCIRIRHTFHTYRSSANLDEKKLFTGFRRFVEWAYFWYPPPPGTKSRPIVDGWYRAKSKFFLVQGTGCTYKLGPQAL